MVVTSIIWTELNQKFNSNLHHISKWLVLNTNETCIVKFTSSKAPIYPLNIIHVEQILAIAETIKFLGLHFNSHLSWTCHVNILLKKLSSVWFMMRSSSYMLNKDTLRIVFFAHFQPLINMYKCLGIINNHASFIFNTKRIKRNMLGLDLRSSCRRGLRN